MRRLPILLLLLCLLAAPAARALPTFDEVRAAHRPSDVQLLSREGEPLQRVRLDDSVRRGDWLALADISPALRTALVLSEDRRFYAHSGVDWAAVSAAAWANLWNRRTRGASTITMQLAGLLDDDWRAGAGGRSAAQKLGQAVAAQVLDRRWRKDQILEAYLNLVPLRGELVGIDALARTLFGKAAHGLDAREAAVAAALVRAPNARAAVVARRACGVLRDMQAGTRVDCDALDLFTEGALQRRGWAPSTGIAPHYARQWLRAAGPDAARRGERTTLSAPLQRVAAGLLARHLRELSGRHVQDGALVVLDNRSGEVLAWVGSSGPLSQAAEVDAVLAPRQPGSTLKPFLYAQAIAERRLTAASLVEDSAAHIPTASGLYVPQNYDRQFKGHVSVRTALAASLNVPAVRTLVMVTPDAFYAQLRALGLPLAQGAGYYGYSLALGASEVPLLHLANAYRALANGGRFTPVRLRAAAAERPGSTGAGVNRRGTTGTAPATRTNAGGAQSRMEPAAPPPRPVQALDAAAAFIVGDILSDTNARVRTFGTDSVLGTRFWTAVKTGTSKDMRDNWAVGWSERYTVAVWVGNASGAAMHDVSGSSGAAPVWAELMQWLHRDLPSRAPKPPGGVVRQAVRFAAAQPAGDWLESPRQEWFLAGTQQALFAMDKGAGSPGGTRAGGQKDLKSSTAAAAAAQAPTARIALPAPGTIIALDPDIPPAHQHLRLLAQDTPAGQALAWRIQGQAVAQGSDAGWLPWPGRHTLELVDTRGHVLDSVRIEVRGAGVRAARR
ncbi:penicillin-binding protein 1C [Oryzisolibacter propanilivorax]|uniref:peptidoglycan glycosyltransferase n=1 Tax=Oryzisolibacter propanilivorax TaxID=1527607 RepID=A0A1G9TJ31_9BURK|nr:penicillin-binding protein 1C [Oryzisolibacter propanilivorax]SDM47632.1 penicillin-binding protein 1C [Oryzisolibacter propanilivorax]